MPRHEPDEVESPIGASIGEMITSGVETGVPAEQFWILAASQINPPLLGAS